MDRDIIVSGGSPGELWRLNAGVWTNIGATIPASAFTGHPTLSSFAGTYPYQVFGFDENEFWIAVSSEGTIFHYKDGTWSLQWAEIGVPTSGLPDAALNEDLQGLFGVSPHLYCGNTSSGGLMYYNGSVWAMDATIINPPGAGRRQNSTWESPGGTAMICTWTGKVLRGSVGSWTSQSTAASDLYCIHGLDATHAWAGGTSGDIVFSSDDGVTWAPQSSGSSDTIMGLWAADATHVWAVTDGGDILFFNGVSWSTAYSDGTKWFYSIYGVSADAVYAVGGKAAGGCLMRAGIGVWSDITGDFPSQPALGDDLRGVWGLEYSNSVSLPIDSILVVAKNVLRVTLTGTVAATSDYLNAANYTITTMVGSGAPSVVSILPAYGYAADTIFVEIHGAVYGDIYNFSINDLALKNMNGISILQSSINWKMHRPKANSIMESIAAAYDTGIGSNLRSIIEAITISDEEIGGDF